MRVAGKRHRRAVHAEQPERVFRFLHDERAAGRFLFFVDAHFDRKAEVAHHELLLPALFAGNRLQIVGAELRGDLVQHGAQRRGDLPVFLRILPRAKGGVGQVHSHAGHAKERLADIFKAKGRVADGVVAAHRVELAHAGVCVGSGLRDEKRVAVLCVRFAHRAERGCVDIRGQNVNGRRGKLPDLHHPGDGAAARVLAGLALLQPAVGGHRDVVRLLTRRSNPVDIGRNVIRAEDLLRHGAEARLPRAGVRAFLHSGAHLVGHILRMGFQVLHQLRGGRPIKQPVCQVGVFPGGREHAGFVFHLHHQHGVFPAVDLPDMRHHRLESSGVGFARFFAEVRKRRVVHRAQNLHSAAALSLLHFRPRETVQILFHPRRSIGALGVFPGAEPDELQLQAVLSGDVDDHIHRGKVKAALLGLDQLPAEGGDDAVHAELHGFPAARLHGFRCGRIRIVQLPRQHDEGMVVNHQNFCASLLFQIWTAHGKNSF